MIKPLLLVLLAVLTAAFVGYGTHPSWITLDGGLSLICAARRFQWPLYAVCIAASLAVVLLVVSGRNRAWWLIGLAPVLVMFVHRFSSGPMRQFRVADQPTLVAASAAHGVQDDDYVVGVVSGPVTAAYPYAALYRYPVVLQTFEDRRVLLLWNPFANIARAATIERALRATELEVVSMPANALLVYNSRYGQFISGITLGFARPASPPESPPAASTASSVVLSKPPDGIGNPVETVTMSWGRWRGLYPDTLVMPLGEQMLAQGPRVPLRPIWKVPPPKSPAGSPSGPVVTDGGDETPVVLLATTRPVAIPPSDISDTPINLTPGGESVVVLRDRRSLRVRAFSRVLPTGEELRFAPVPGRVDDTPPQNSPEAAPTDSPDTAPNRTGAPQRSPTNRRGSRSTPPLRPAPTARPSAAATDSAAALMSRAAMIDLVAGEPWSAAGLPLNPAGRWKGMRLTPIEVDEGGYFGVLRYWVPGLTVHHVTSADFATFNPLVTAPTPQANTPSSPPR